MLNNEINLETIADSGFNDIDYPEDVAIRNRISQQLMNPGEILDNFIGEDDQFAKTAAVIRNEQVETINDLLLEDEDLCSPYSLTAD